MSSTTSYKMESPTADMFINEHVQCSTACQKSMNTKSHANKYK